MTPETLLLRQIHPSFIQQGRVTSQAFKPTPKDENKLSVDNGDLIKPSDSWQRFINNPQCKSDGVMAITAQECTNEVLVVIEDANPYPEHCSIDFYGLSNAQISKKAKTLKMHAENRGWQYKA